MRILFSLMVLVLAVPAFAQDTITFNDSIGDVGEDIHLIEIDFGVAAISVTLQLDIAATSGSGLDVRLQDLDGLLDNSGTQEDSDSSATPMTLNLTTGSMSGVHQFFIWATASSFSGFSDYSATLSSAALPAGSITLVDTQTIALGTLENIVHDRMWVIRGQASGTYSDTFISHSRHTGSPRDVRFHLGADGGALGDFTLREVILGTGQTVGTLSGPGEIRGNFADRGGRDIHLQFDSAGPGPVNAYLLIGIDSEVYFKACDYGCDSSQGCTAQNTGYSSFLALLLFTAAVFSLRLKLTDV
ncbi:hypothetical protein OAU50_00550 [Planctomycetota bacterium]|nr:hypothetical protein [Planctomycetota bacterium]